MNSRERIFAALKRKEPDRVPLMELGIDLRTISFLCQNCSYLDFVEKVGLDAVVISEIRDAGDHKWIDEKKKESFVTSGVLPGVLPMKLSLFPLKAL